MPHPLYYFMNQIHAFVSSAEPEGVLFKAGMKVLYRNAL